MLHYQTLLGLNYPKELKAIKQIPMNTLTDKLKDLRGIEKEIVIPNWGIATAVGISAIITGIAIFLL